MSTRYHVLNEITVSRQSLLHNYAYFQALNPQAQLAVVVKSNAYGHGLIPVAQLVASEIKPPLLCVDSLYEAYELTKAGIHSDILIMGYTDPRNYQVKRRLPYIFSVFDLATAQTLNRFQPGARVHLKLDTGMTRLGVSLDQLPDFLRHLRTLDSLKLEGVFSHLASADDPAQISRTRQQIKLFKSMYQQVIDCGFSPTFRHIAATAGASLIRDPFFNLVRLGLGFYGYSPFGPHTAEGRQQRTELRPTLTLTTHIAALKPVARGTTIGYGATYIAKQQETIAVLPLGYNEGINRDLSNRGSFLLADGTACPIVGRVSMNMTTVKIPRGHAAAVGDPLTLVSAYDQATPLGTIPYNILTSLHPTIRRTVI